jgi:hypothetical protein
MIDRRTFLSESLIGGISALLVGNIKLCADRVKSGVPNVVAKKNGRWLAAILRADHPNGNKRIYPREILEKVVERFHRDGITTIGQFGMPKDGIIRINDMSHMVMDLQMKDDYLVAEIAVMDTPQGKILNQLLRSFGDVVAFRTAGVGFGETNDDGCLEIASFQLAGIHAIPASEAAAL